MIPLGRGYPEGMHFFHHEIYNLTGRIRQRGKAGRDHDAKASGTADTSYEEVATQPFLFTEQTTPDPSASAGGAVNAQWITSCHVFGQLAVAIYNVAAGPAFESVLLTETSSTNAALSQRTYAKGDAIIALDAVRLSATQYCHIGLRNAASRLITSLAATPGTDAAMHANTLGNTGVCQTALPGEPWAFEAAGTFYVLSGSAATGDAPTATLTNFPQSGWMIGLQSMGGGPPRVHMVKRKRIGTYTHPAGSSSGTEVLTDFEGQWITTLQNGTDPQILNWPLSKILLGDKVRDGVVASDQNRIIFHNGRFIKDLRIFEDFLADSDRDLRVTNFYIQEKTELFAEVNEIASVGGTGATLVYILKYDWDNDTWNFVSTQITLTGQTGIQSFIAGKSLPVSELTGFFHQRLRNGSGATAGSFFRKWQQPPGMNPYNFRKTAGATAASGKAYAASATLTLPVIEFEGFEGCLLKPTRLVGPPSANIGFYDSGATTQQSVQIELYDGARAVTFSAREGQTLSALHRPEARVNMPWVQALQPILTITQQVGGTDPTLKASNMLDSTIEGFLYRPPLDVPEPPTGRTV